MTIRAWLLLAILLALVVGHRGMVAAQATGAGGEARVIDGDTLAVDGTIVQLFGIDAPELGQLCASDGSFWPCGVDAALALRKLVAFGGHALHCSPWGAGPPERTADGALVEVCEVGDEDLALVMLHNGYGVALPGSFPDYAEAEQRAKEGHLGIWHSEFVLPRIWRDSDADPGQPQATVRDCNVKGTRGADGAPIYHVPTDLDYQGIAIDPARGERMFCSDEEARLAGWARPAEPRRSE